MSSKRTPSVRAAVLVVDDDTDAREMLTEYLSSCGFLVYTASNGLDAIMVALRERPSIILMDLMMPRMDGFEATRRLKADARTKAIPIIAFSAHSQMNGRQVARAAGCDDLLRKPCDLDQLAEEVRKRLDRRAESAGSPSITMGSPSLQDALAADTALDDAIAAALEPHARRNDRTR